MKILLKDGTEMIVDKKTAEAIERSIEKSPQGFIRVNGSLINKTFINAIKPGGVTEASYDEKAKKLKADNRSDGERYKAARKKSNEIRKKLSKKLDIKRSN